MCKLSCKCITTKSLSAISPWRMMSPRWKMLDWQCCASVFICFELQPCSNNDQRETNFCYCHHKCRILFVQISLILQYKINGKSNYIYIYISRERERNLLIFLEFFLNCCNVDIWSETCLVLLSEYEIFCLFGADIIHKNIHSSLSMQRHINLPQAQLPPVLKVKF